MVNDGGILLGRSLDKIAYGLLIFSLSLDHLDCSSIGSDGNVSSTGSIFGMIRGAVLGHIDDTLGKT